MKTLQKVVIEEAYLSKINPNMTNQQLTSYSMVKRTEGIPSKIRRKARMPTLTTFLFNIVLQS